VMAGTRRVGFMLMITFVAVVLSSARQGYPVNTEPGSVHAAEGRTNRLADLIPPRQPPQGDVTRVGLLPRARSDFSEAPSDEGDEGKSEPSIDLTMDDLNDSGTGGHPGTHESASPSFYEELRESESSSVAVTAPVPLSLPALHGTEPVESERESASTSSSNVPILPQPSQDESRAAPKPTSVLRGQGIRAISSGVVKGSGLKDQDVVTPPSHRTTGATGAAAVASTVVPPIVVRGSGESASGAPSGSGKRSGSVLASGWLTKPGPQPTPLYGRVVHHSHVKSSLNAVSFLCVVLAADTVS
jgi:hypothetical protein